MSALLLVSTGYVGDYQAKTVVIDPFTTAALSSAEFQTWIGKAKDFYIRRTWKNSRYYFAFLLVCPMNST